MTDTQAPAIDFAEYEKKKVVVTIGDPRDKDKPTEEYEGTILVVTPVAVMFKPKGSAGQTIFMREQVLACQLVIGNTKITQKHLRPIDLGGNRQHLVDRHGFTISWANNHTEDEAASVHLQQHFDLDKELGHTHKAATPTAREEAIAGAEAQTSGDEPDDDAEPSDEVMEGQETLF